MNDQVNANVISAWASKINWTQAVGIFASVLVMVSGGRYDMPVDVQLQVVAVIQAVQAVATWVMRTWFTTAIVQSSAQKM